MKMSGRFVRFGYDTRRGRRMKRIESKRQRRREQRAWEAWMAQPPHRYGIREP